MSIRFHMDEVRDRVFGVEEIATLPPALASILSVTKDPHSTAMDLAEEIGKDPALAAKVLKTVNSSFYGFGRRIQTVNDAVVLLGYIEVERLALAITVINLFGGDWKQARFLSQLWRHSLAASIAADLVGKASKAQTTDIAGAHVAGLLHDIGKAVLSQSMPDVFPVIIELVERNGYDPLTAEQEVLDGVDHSEIGGWIANNWSLPPSIVESIRTHHNPDKATSGRILPHITHLANAICHSIDVPSMVIESPTAAQIGSPDSWALLGLDDSIIDHTLQRIENQRDFIGAMSARTA